MKYKLIIFDLDGTLLNTIDDLGEAVNHAMRLRNFPLHTHDEYKLMVGNGVRKLVTRALPEVLKEDETLVDAALADFVDYYTAHIDIHTTPYPGMFDLVYQLHKAGVLMAVASNKFQEGTEFLIRKFFPGIPFVAVLGNRSGFPLKPDPAIVREVLQKANLTPADALMVGDSPTDMKTAENGGIRGVAVSWGYRPIKSSPSLTVVDSAAELLQLMQD